MNNRNVIRGNVSKFCPFKNMLLYENVEQAQPIFRDPKRYPDMADPNLNNDFPEKDLNQVVAIAAMCLQEEAAARPLMSDVVTALSFLSTANTEGGADNSSYSGGDSDDSGSAKKQVSEK